jgi:hypothetical protein
VPAADLIDLTYAAATRRAAAADRGQDEQADLPRARTSESTVKTHLASIFRRLGATSRTQVVVAAARMGQRLGPCAEAPEARLQ